MITQRLSVAERNCLPLQCGGKVNKKTHPCEEMEVHFHNCNESATHARVVMAIKIKK
jgi:hypothetical protein